LSRSGHYLLLLRAGRAAKADDARVRAAAKNEPQQGLRMNEGRYHSLLLLLLRRYISINSGALPCEIALAPDNPRLHTRHGEAGQGRKSRLFGWWLQVQFASPLSASNRRIGPVQHVEWRKFCTFPITVRKRICDAAYTQRTPGRRSSDGVVSRRAST
jgi:hypothetical protein